MVVLALGGRLCVESISCAAVFVFYEESAELFLRFKNSVRFGYLIFLGEQYQHINLVVDLVLCVVPKRTEQVVVS